MNLTCWPSRKGLELRVKCQDISIYTDKVLLERILRNLLGNAIKYTDKGRIFLGARKVNSQIKIYLIDTGRGIDDSEKEIIMEPYQRGHKTGDIDGLGLGLAIVKQTCEILNLRISLESKINDGTKIIISS